MFDRLLIKEEEQRTAGLRGGIWGSQSSEITGLAPGERLRKPSSRLRALDFRRVDFGFSGGTLRLL